MTISVRVLAVVLVGIFGLFIACNRYVEAAPPAVPPVPGTISSAQARCPDQAEPPAAIQNFFSIRFQGPRGNPNGHEVDKISISS